MQPQAKKVSSVLKVPHIKFTKLDAFFTVWEQSSRKVNLSSNQDFERHESKYEVGKVFILIKNQNLTVISRNIELHPNAPRTNWIKICWMKLSWILDLGQFSKELQSSAYEYKLQLWPWKGRVLQTSQKGWDLMHYPEALQRERDSGQIVFH